MLVGQTMIGWRVWDVMRTIDWIATRPELDAARVGCLGCSGKDLIFTRDLAVQHQDPTIADGCFNR